MDLGRVLKISGWDGLIVVLLIKENSSLKEVLIKHSFLIHCGLISIKYNKLLIE